LQISPLHYLALPPKLADLSEEAATTAIIRARQRLKRAVGLHPAEANLLALEAALSSDERNLAARLRMRFYGRYWREANASRIASPWKIEKKSDKVEKPSEGPRVEDGPVDPFSLPELGIDGPDGGTESSTVLGSKAGATLVSRALNLIAAGKNAEAACENLAKLPEDQVWSRIRELEGLVGEARPLIDVSKRKHKSNKRTE
jgi:hypothetical protein